MDISDVQTTSWCGFHIPLLWPENPKGLILETENTKLPVAIFTHLDLPLSHTKLSHQHKNSNVDF